ncbi:MAG: hypothetical protein LBB23_04090 [Rickettsiales bacterium]|jgi:hypothetical protein|nr:hypothetical protein [Rickettsiales bacterium]
MDLTYLKKQAEFVSDLGIGELSGMRKGAVHPFAGALFDWSLVRINEEALTAIKKLAAPERPIWKELDFNFKDYSPLQDMAVLNAPEFKAYMDMIPSHQRSLAKIDFDVLPKHENIKIIEVSERNYYKSLAEVLHHASTPEFFETFLQKSRGLPDADLAMFLFWELKVMHGAAFRVLGGDALFRTLAEGLPAVRAFGHIPSLVFAKNKGAAADILESLPDGQSAAVVSGEVDVAAWIVAAEFAKSFIGGAMGDYEKMPFEVIRNWMKSDGD